MSLHRAKIGTLTIANGGTNSNVLSSKLLKMAKALVIDTAESAFTGTISLLAAAEEGAAFSDLLAVRAGGAAVAVTADSIEQFDVSPGCSIAVQSSGAEAAERNIDIYAILAIAGV